MPQVREVHFGEQTFSSTSRERKKEMFVVFTFFFALLMESKDRINIAPSPSSLDKLPLPPPLPLDDDEPWWVLPACKADGGESESAFVLAGGCPAETTPLAAMLARVVVSSSSSSSTSSASLPLPHADAALAMRLLEERPKESVASCQALFDRGGVEALTAVAASCPALAAAAAAVAAATATTTTTTEEQQSFPADLSLFEASPLASSWLDAFLRAPVTLQWAEAASRLSSSGASAPWRKRQRHQPPPPTPASATAATEANLLPPPSFTRAAVSRALQAAQEKQQEQEQRIASASSSPAGPSAVVGEAPTATTAENAPPLPYPPQQPNDFAAVRLAVALVRSMLRSASAKKALSDAASRCELEAFCLASAASRDAAALFRDIKAGSLFQ